MKIDMSLHNQFLEILPQINAAKYYGEATKLIREKLDSRFNKYDADAQPKLFEVDAEIVTRETKSVRVEALDEEEAYDLAKKKLEMETLIGEEVEVYYAREIK